MSTPTPTVSKKKEEKEGVDNANGITVHGVVDALLILLQRHESRKKELDFKKSLLETSQEEDERIALLKEIARLESLIRSFEKKIRTLLAPLAFLPK